MQPTVSERFKHHKSVHGVVQRISILRNYCGYQFFFNGIPTVVPERSLRIPFDKMNIPSDENERTRVLSGETRR